MKIFRIFQIFFPIFLFGCVLLNTKNSMGIQSIKNETLSMVDIYEVLKNNLSDYEIQLHYTPENSSYMLFPKIGWIYTKEHYSIFLTNENFSIIIQHSIDAFGDFKGIHLDYYIRGGNVHERVNELYEPMAKIKSILCNNFSELKEENFTEKFQPIPIH
jgi:hypothetical protein